MKPKLIIFASGSKDGGGSGFRELVENSLVPKLDSVENFFVSSEAKSKKHRNSMAISRLFWRAVAETGKFWRKNNLGTRLVNQKGVLDAEIVAVVSNHENGGVRKIADEYGINFVHFNGPFTVEEYQKIIKETGAEWISLSGWLKLALGLDPRTTINIHPGRIPQFGGSGMYGHFVHEATIEAYKRGEIKRSAVTMHFVTEIYDDGPVFFEYPVWIRKDDTPETLAQRVNKIEHGWQSYITNLVIYEKIKWDGKDPKTLIVPKNYNFHHNHL